MLEQFDDRQFTFMITTVGALLGTIFTAAMTLLLAPKIKNNSTSPAEKQSQENTPNSVTISNIVVKSKETYNRTVDQQGLVAMGSIGILIIVSIYFFNRSYFMLAMSLGIGSALFILNGVFLLRTFQRYIQGAKAVIISIISILYSAVYMYGLSEIYKPTYGPKNFVYAEKILNDSGVIGLSKSRYFGMEDLNFALLHVAGIALLISSAYLMVSLLVNTLFTARDTLKGSPQSYWAIKTSKFHPSFTKFCRAFLLSTIGIWLISGGFLYWIEFFANPYMEGTINTFLYGRS